MKSAHSAATLLFRGFLLCLSLVIAAPAAAQSARKVLTPGQVMPDQRNLEQFRLQYDTMMSNFEKLAAKQGNASAQAMARQGREIMSQLNDQQLGMAFSRGSVPDLTSALLASELSATRQPNAMLKSLPFPVAVDIVAGCVGVDIEAATRYALFIIKEVANAILAAAAWVCNEDILGENGSLACVPLAIAADVANGFFDTATFCAGEVTANQVDGNYNRLEHIHNDLSAGITTITNNDNANKTAIITNDNTNTTNIIANDNSNKTAIISNDNTNTATILANANANTNTLVAAIQNLSCEIIRLLNTPDGLKASAILACSGQPGYPYKWNKPTN